MHPSPTDRETITLVEDDLELANLIKGRLESEGFLVSHEANGKDACARILAEPPSLVVLDIMLPGMDGFEVCKQVRPAYTGPILILTARDDDLDQVLGLELGADDFVIKPVQPRVLIARIRALLRRTRRVEAGTTTRRVAVGELVVDAGRREVSLRDETVDLTTIEFDLLWYAGFNKEVQHLG